MSELSDDGLGSMLISHNRIAVAWIRQITVRLVTYTAKGGALKCMNTRLRTQNKSCNTRRFVDLRCEGNDGAGTSTRIPPRHY